MVPMDLSSDEKRRFRMLDGNDLLVTWDAETRTIVPLVDTGDGSLYNLPEFSLDGFHGDLSPWEMVVCAGWLYEYSKTHDIETQPITLTRGFIMYSFLHARVLREIGSFPLPLASGSGTIGDPKEVIDVGVVRELEDGVQGPSENRG